MLGCYVIIRVLEQKKKNDFYIWDEKVQVDVFENFECLDFFEFFVFEKDVYFFFLKMSIMLIFCLNMMQYILVFKVIWYCKLFRGVLSLKKKKEDYILIELQYLNMYQ